MDGDDPWHWSTDRVVQELCTPQRSWQPRASLQDLPADVSGEFEGKLREEGVDGCVLLADVTDTVMIRDLGLTRLAWRVFILGAIEILRLRSPHYQQYRLKHHTASQISSYHPASLAGYQILQQIQVPPTPPAQQISPLIRNPVLPVESLNEAQLSATPVDSRKARGEFTITDSLGNKRRKLDLSNAASNLALQGDDDAFYEDPEPEQVETPATETPQADNNMPTALSEPTEINGKKRKRIAPTLISSEIDSNRNRDIPTAADDVVHNDPQKIEPGVLFRGEDGRKRLVPVHQQDAGSDEPYDYQALLMKSRAPDAQVMNDGGEATVNIAQQAPKKVENRKALVLAQADGAGYLGNKKMSVDDIFYKGIPVGQEIPLLEDSHEFSEGLKDISGGRRLYMHRVMKRYLRSDRNVLLRDGKFFSAVRPYATKFMPRHHKPSFTLYYVSEDGKIHARREELRLWPEIDPEALPPTTDAEGNHVTFNVLNPGILNLVGSGNDPLDPDLLEKYKYINGGDEVLPLYGESDEENEYDLDTWKEIEKERGEKLDRPLRPLAKQPLDAKSVHDAIDELVSETVAHWNQKKLPRKLHKAFKIWKKHRPKDVRLARLGNRQAKLAHVIKRIANLRKEIAEEPWTSKEKVRKQARILEPSIFDREDYSWEIRVLESKTQPEKLPPKAPSEARSKKSALLSDDGEEGESIRTEASSSDGELDDFVVDDSPLGTEEEKELNLADGEDEDDAMLSDIGLPGLSRKLPISRKLFFKRSSIRSSRHSVQDDEPMPDASEDPFLSEDSDAETPVKDEPNLPKLPATTPKTNIGMIDLTMTSSDDGPRILDPSTPKKKKATMLKLTDRNSPFAVSDSDEPRVPDPENLPPLENTSAIAKFSHRVWVAIPDRERLLVSVIHGMPAKMRDSIFQLTADTETQLWANMAKVMDSIRKARDDVKGMDVHTIETLCVLIRLFAMWVDSKYYPFREKPRSGEVASLQYEHKKYPDFYAFCRKIERYFERYRPSPQSPARNELDDDDDENGEPRTATRRRSKALNTSDDDNSEQDTPHKLKRKKKIYEDANARDLRKQDRERIAAQEERRKKLRANLAKSGDLGGATDIIINETKEDEEAFIYVSRPEIARKIKEHQIDGVRFMWNQIVKGNQGCLLAHTMGLGKTMQAITLLVAISEASSSTDENVFNQIPSRLRASKTLILCPPGLIDNWMDELLTWAPPNSLGGLFKVDSTMKPLGRLRDIDHWYNDGGVLILGYEMFRGFINNKTAKGKEVAPLDEEQHAQVFMQLTEGPNIIIADEAHKMKNATAAITVAASKLESSSRIALTGSPLANNVKEYHTMIEWVAPNYLGPAVEFKVKYVEPIQDGLWYESTAYERRKSLKMLGVLKEDLSPKVHRADMSVLRNDLPPKKEFVITVPLTELQSKAYSIYVKSMTSAAAPRTNDGEITQTTLWHWLAVLSLLCNHPSCFMAKLTERKADASAKKVAQSSAPASRDVTDQEDIGLDLNASTWKVGVSESLVQDEQSLFAADAPNMKSIELSHKTQVLCQILDASKDAGDKVLVFSQSIPTLNFLEEMCQVQGRNYARLDGTTKISKRQNLTKSFNTGDLDIYLISTNAGGLGLNLYGANRIVIFDFKFNPINEEQAVGRAYRIGQKKDVFVYRFVAGGTFEDSVHNKAIFKKQLASRVVDKKNPIAWAKKGLSEFLFEPKEVEQQDLTEFEGMDPMVLDKILASQGNNITIRAIVQSDTFEKDDDEVLTVEEQKEVKQLISDEKLKRSNPAAYMALVAQRNRAPVIPAARPNPSIGVSHFSAGTSGSQRLPAGSMRAPPSQIHSNRVSNHPVGPAPQRSASGSILPPPRPGSSLNRAASAMQAAVENSITRDFVQPRSGFAVPSPSLAARFGSDSPGTTSKNTPRGVTVAPSHEASKATDGPATVKPVQRPESQQQPNRGKEGDEDEVTAKPATESDMYKAMNRRPVNSLRTPVTKKPGRKAKPPLPRRIQDTRPKSATQSSTSLLSIPTSTPRPTPTPIPAPPNMSSPKNKRLPNWAMDNINEAKSRNGKSNSPASSSRTTTPKE